MDTKQSTGENMSATDAAKLVRQLVSTAAYAHTLQALSDHRESEAVRLLQVGPELKSVLMESVDEAFSELEPDVFSAVECRRRFPYVKHGITQDMAVRLTPENLGEMACYAVMAKAEPEVDEACTAWRASVRSQMESIVPKRALAVVDEAVRYFEGESARSADDTACRNVIMDHLANAAKAAGVYVPHGPDFLSIVKRSGARVFYVWWSKKPVPDLTYAWASQRFHSYWSRLLWHFHSAIDNACKVLAQDPRWSEQIDILFRKVSRAGDTAWKGTLTELEDIRQRISNAATASDLGLTRPLNPSEPPDALTDK